MHRRKTLSGLITVALLAACQASPHPTGTFVLSAQHAPAALAVQVATPGSLLYVARADWIRAEAVISNPGLGLAPTLVTALPSEDAAHGQRTATLNFGSLAAGTGYVVTLRLIRLVGAAEIVAATVTQTDVALVPGANTLALRPAAVPSAQALPVPPKAGTGVALIAAGGGISPGAAPVRSFVDSYPASGAPGSFAQAVGIIAEGDELVVADVESNRLRRVVPLFPGSSTYAVGTLLGGGTVLSVGNLGEAAPGSVAAHVDGDATTARLSFPWDIVRTAPGIYYVTESGAQQISKVVRNLQTGAITLQAIAGSGAVGDDDGPGTSATFNYPTGLAAAPDGSLFCTENESGAIRHITFDVGGNTTVTTIAGQPTIAGQATVGFQDGAGAQALFNYPLDIACDAAGAVYVADGGNNRVRRIDIDGLGNATVSTFAGGDAGYLDGLASQAQFGGPSGLAFDSQGALYVSDFGNQRVRKIFQGVVTTVMGTGEASDTDGPHGTFNEPLNLCFGSDGSLFVGEQTGASLRRIVFGAGGPTLQTAVPGTEHGFADGIAGPLFYHEPNSALPGPGGTLLVADGDRLIRIEADGKTATTLSTDVGSGALARDPADATGRTFYIASSGSVSRVVLDAGGTAQVTLVADGNVLQPTQSDSLPGVTGIAVAADGTIYVADAAGQCIRALTRDPQSGIFTNTLIAGDVAHTPGLQDGLGTTSRFNAPWDIALDPTGDLWVADIGNNCVRRLVKQAVGGQWLVSTPAGNGTAGYAEGTGPVARFRSPQGIAAAPDGTIFVSDSGNSVVRALVPAAAGLWTASTLAGDGVSGYFDGPPHHARFVTPTHLALDAGGQIFVADSGSNWIRRIR